MDYKKKYESLKKDIELVRDQLCEKRLNEKSLRDATFFPMDAEYHDYRMEVFSESVADIDKILTE